MDMYAIVRNIFEPFLNIFNNLITVISLSAIAIIILFFAFFSFDTELIPLNQNLLFFANSALLFCLMIFSAIYILTYVAGKLKNLPPMDLQFL